MIAQNSPSRPHSGGRRSWIAAIAIAVLLLGLLNGHGMGIARAAETSTVGEAEDGTASPSPSPGPTEEPLPSPTASATESPPSTQTPTPEETVAPSASPVPLESPTASPTASPTPTPTPTAPVTTAPEEPRTKALNEAPDEESMSGPESRSAVSIFAAGVPADPGEVWIETFEQGLNTTAPSGIATYAGGRYTASSGWAAGTNCTGVLVNYTATYPNAQFCPSQASGANTSAAREVRRLADVLGQLGADTPGSTSASAPASASSDVTRGNHALVARPYATISAGQTTVAQSASALGLTASASRYYSLRFDAAAAPCGTGTPALALSLFSGGTTLLNAFPTAVNPCAATGAVFYTSTPVLAASGGGTDPGITTSARAATYTGTAAAVLTPAQIAAAQIRLTNTARATGSGFGVDNLRVLDVTPSLDWGFSPDSVPEGTPSTLTYTVTNTTDLIAKNDWSFTNTLPAGLVVAPTPAVGGTCTQVAGTAFAVTAAAGGSSIAAVGGDLATGAASCTVTVDVVATAEGSFTNAPEDVVTVLDPPEAASLTATPASRLTVRKDLPARASSTDQFTLSVRSGSTVLASATTTGTATGIQPAQVSRLIVTAGQTYTINETPTSGSAIGYASSYDCVRDGTVVATGTSRSGSITMPEEDGAEIVCTFRNTLQQQRLACDSGLFYGVTTNGALIQGDIVGGGQATVGSWSNVTGANSLGIGAGGTLAYALNRSGDAANVLSILKWSTTGGFETLPGTGYTTVGAGGAAVPGSLVAGAVDLTTGRYLFGKFNGGVFHLWSFTESAPAANRFAYVGSFNAGAAPNGNGDMAFDSRGNLYVLGAATVNNASSVAIFTVTAQTLAAASGGTLAVSTSTPRALTGLDGSPTFGSANGLAFSPRGTVYVSSNTSTYEFDPSSWVRIAGSSRLDFASTDLATCTSPGTVTVQKNVVGRAAAADQFTLTLAGESGTVGTATSTGSTTGRQTAQVGPFPARVNTVLTVSEAMAAGSTSAIGAYTVRLECWTDGVRIVNTTTISASVTMPDRLGANVVCTFFNSPSPVATVTVTKRVLDPATGQSAPAAGWSLGVAGTATTGTVTVLPSEAPRQNSDASGNAAWTVLFGSAASRATLVVSEVQQTGFTFVSGTCTVNGSAVAASFTTVGGLVSASLPGIAPSATVACTLTNQPITTLTLVKSVSFGTAAPTAWLLSAQAPQGALPGPSGTTGVAATTNVPVSPGRPYRLSETGGTAAYVQVGAWRCVESTGAEVAVTPAGDVTVRTGAAVTCTVTNATATMTLLKDVVTPSPGFEASTWTITATPAVLPGGTLPVQNRVGATYNAAGNPASTFEVRPGHEYTLSEAPTVPGTRLAYQTLRLERLDGTSWTPVPSRTITAPPAGSNVVYRFVNAPVAGPVLPLTGGLGADAFAIAGGLLLAVMLAGALMNGKRRTMRRRLGFPSSFSRPSEPPPSLPPHRSATP